MALWWLGSRRLARSHVLTVFISCPLGQGEGRRPALPSIAGLCVLPVGLSLPLGGGTSACVAVETGLVGCGPRLSAPPTLPLQSAQLVTPSPAPALARALTAPRIRGQAPAPSSPYGPHAELLEGKAPPLGLAVLG